MGKWFKTPYKSGIWKERKASKDKLAYLSDDLKYRRMKELRFVHKLLRWPSFTRSGRVMRRSPFKKHRNTGDWEPSRASARNKYIEHLPYTQFLKTSSAPFKQGWAQYLDVVRTTLLRTAGNLGVNLSAAASFDAGKDFRLNVGKVWFVDPLELDVNNDEFEWLKEGEKRGQGEMIQNFGDKDEHRFEDEEGWTEPLQFGEVVYKKGIPWIHIRVGGRGTAELYRAVETDPRSQWKRAGHPPFVVCQSGLHNGSPRPAVYAKVSPRGCPKALVKKLEEIKKLERREKELSRLLGDLSNHGYEMLACVRSSCRSSWRRSKECGRLVKEYEEATPQRKRELHGSYMCALYCEQFLGSYLNEGAGYCDPNGFIRIPLEYEIAKMECYEGVSFDT